jgi:hypothetical protein
MGADRRVEATGNAGTELERRVARLEFAEGALARPRVPVRVAADPGRSILTDIDVLAVDVDNRLRISRSILECKTTKGQSGEPDRLLWLAGLQHYTRTGRAVLVRQTITQRRLDEARSAFPDTDRRTIRPLAASVVASLHPDGGSAFHQHYQGPGLKPSLSPMTRGALIGAAPSPHHAGYAVSGRVKELSGTG